MHITKETLQEAMKPDAYDELERKLNSNSEVDLKMAAKAIVSFAFYGPLDEVPGEGETKPPELVTLSGKITAPEMNAVINEAVNRVYLTLHIMKDRSDWITFIEAEYCFRGDRLRKEWPDPILDENELYGAMESSRIIHRLFRNAAIKDDVLHTARASRRKK
jgi:hypothetical protein